MAKTAEGRNIPPAIEDVREFIKSNNYPINVDKWWNFYTAKDWMVGKNKMKDWHAAVRTWLPENFKSICGNCFICRKNATKSKLYHNKRRFLCQECIDIYAAAGMIHLWSFANDMQFETGYYAAKSKTVPREKVEVNPVEEVWRID